MKNESLFTGEFHVFGSLFYSTWLTCIAITSALGADFNPPPVDQLIPADKKLDPAWVASLTARGEPQVYRGDQLKWIGLPVGGLFCGQLQLGGDGSLWTWDIFNENVFTGWSGHYGGIPVTKKLEEGFSLKIGDKVVPLNATGFSDISFRGEYPIGYVNYADPSVPLKVKLEAFSPFIPLNPDDSGLPATIMNFTVTNSSDKPVEATLSGNLENFVVFRERGAISGQRVNKVTKQGDSTYLEESISAESDDHAQPDHVIEDWNKKDFSGWAVEGNAFGSGPIARKDMPQIYSRMGGEGDYVVDSEVNAPGQTLMEKGDATGKLTSQPFLIDRKHLGVWLGDESTSEKMGINLIVDGKIVSEMHGLAIHRRQLALHGFDLSPYQGKQGVLEIYDNDRGDWGEVTVGKIVLSDRNVTTTPIDQLEDNGSMGLALLNATADDNSGDQTAPIAEKLIGSLGHAISLKPGESTTVRFVISWFFPNLTHLPVKIEQGRWYSSKFTSASNVAKYIADNEERLVGETELWHATWYDSTLPYWFLDRTMINTSILATSTSYRLKNGRYWAYEGVGSCNGTPGHVYGYAQATARLFPLIEREQREMVDYAVSQHPEGWIDNRGECKDGPSIDAQAYYILRTLREHQMAPDNGFLSRVWPHVKLAMDYMIAQDGQDDGIIRGSQHNTLDANWYGEVSWYSGLYQAALRATAVMADKQGDHAYATKCTEIADRGEAYMAKNLFNGEYYQNKIDPAHLDAINSGSGCEIDQISGQAWGYILGLPRVFPEKETITSLHSLWRYNFTPDVGPFRAVYKTGRNYAGPGDGGVIMCTFPRPDQLHEIAELAQLALVGLDALDKLLDFSLACFRRGLLLLRRSRRGFLLRDCRGSRKSRADSNSGDKFRIHESSWS